MKEIKLFFIEKRRTFIEHESETKEGFFLSTKIGEGAVTWKYPIGLEPQLLEVFKTFDEAKVCFDQNYVRGQNELRENGFMIMEYVVTENCYDLEKVIKENTGIPYLIKTENSFIGMLRQDFVLWDKYRCKEPVPLIFSRRKFSMKPKGEGTNQLTNFLTPEKIANTYNALEELLQYLEEKNTENYEVIF